MAEDWIELDADSPSDKGLKLLGFLMKNIKGQDSALKNLVDAIEVYESGLFNADRPIYVGLFLGPSGVGKTLVAEVLAEYWFGLRNAFTKISCEAYSEEHAISKLIGSPAGYVGHWNPNDQRKEGTPPILWQGNIDRFAKKVDSKADQLKNNFDKALKEASFIEMEILNELVKRFSKNPLFLNKENWEKFESRLKNLVEQYLAIQKKVDNTFYEQAMYETPNPRSIILFDEIEKASHTLHNILLNVIDKAELQLANGMVTKFNNSIILMTSNISSKAIASVLKEKKRMGFAAEMDKEIKRDAASLDKEIYDKSMEAVYDFFPPEFLARFDRISVFRPLSEKIMREILDVELKRFQEKMFGTFPIVLQISDEAKNLILKEATDKPQNGARLLKIKIDKYLRKQICRLKNKGELDKGDILQVTLKKDDKDKIVFLKLNRPSK
jgi:ATP-dependent Clp protease ATP-binding subunit ClpA